LRIADGELRMALPANCSSELKDTIRQHKSALVQLMGLTFLIVWSQVLNTIVFFAADDSTAESLVSAGAERGSIYTREELEVLVRGRVKAKELRRLHEAKRIFSGKWTNS
jgi:hypothetical protein